MRHYFTLTLFLVYGLVAVGTSSSIKELERHLKLRGISIQSVQIDGHYYFWDNAVRNYEESETFCREVDRTADLAVLKGRATYLNLRLGNDVPVGSYWITGKESTGGSAEDETNKYSGVTFNCKPAESVWSLKGITLRQSGTTVNCLLFVKGSSVTNTYIHPVPCNGRFRTMCSMPIDEDFCIEPPATGGYY